MKKSIITKLIVVMAISALFIVACGNDTEITSDNHEPIVELPRFSDIVTEHGEDVQIVGLQTGEYTYVRTDIPIENDINMVSLLAVTDGIVYGAAEIWSTVDEDGSILFFSIDTNDNELFIYPQPELLMRSLSVAAMTVNSEGDIFFVLREFMFDTNEGAFVYTLAQIDVSGNIGFSVDISEHFAGLNLLSLALDDTGNIYLELGTGDVVLFDSAGNHQYTFSIHDMSWSGTAGNPWQREDGTMLFPVWGRKEDESYIGNFLFGVQAETRSMEFLQLLPRAHLFAPGLNGNELLLLSETGVYKYFLETGEQEKVFHWLGIGMQYNFGKIFPVIEGQFALVDHVGSRWPAAVTLLTRTAVEEDTRQIVTVSSLNPNYPLINLFNEQNEHYRIVVKDYSNDDISVARTRFNIDMIAGRVADIIDFSQLDYRILANGGFLADLNPWFEQDSQLNRSDFFESVFELLEINDNLYALPPTFMFFTYLAPASLVGTTPGITLERLIQLEEQFNDGHSLLRGMSPQVFLEMHWLNSKSFLVDYSAGTVYFETGAFIEALDYASRLQAGDFFAEHPFEVAVRRGEKSIAVHMIDNIGQLHYIETVAGTEITAIGFPVESGVGSLMIPSSLYGMGYGTQNSSGAWEFLRFLLAEEQQREIAIESIPLSRLAFDEVIYELMNPAPLPPGADMHVEGGIFVDGAFIEFPPLSRNQADRILGMIETLGGVFTGGEWIVRDIILEEADAFFRGIRPAEEAARVIQSRAQIYVWELQG